MAYYGNTSWFDSGTTGKVGSKLNISSYGKAVTGIDGGTYAVSGRTCQGYEVEVSGGLNNVGFKAK